MSASAVVLHGHFYQPPREDPWTGRIAAQPSAAPSANWNERIARECYAPLAEAGAFEWLSFDVGPTLARWLEREDPATYESILAGDRASTERLGFGNAVAQPYHHIILPLASRSERRTEIRWGLQDFERRFNRASEGMWLPETAVDLATLEAVAEAGAAFTILAPHQIVDPPGGGIGRVRLGGGRQIAVCLYDGGLSHGVAFGELLADDAVWFDRIQQARAQGSSLVALATDGETFGHHHAGADRTLGAVMARIRASPGLRLENFASVLARAGDLPEVQLVEPSAWSCPHGVERWRSECGCKMAPEVESQQAWRAPLRDALTQLAGRLTERYRTLAAGRIADAEAALAGLGRALGRTDELRRYAVDVTEPGADSDETEALLELVRDAGALFTSCGWFFDDVAGLEAAQNLRYAAHAIDRLATLDVRGARELELHLIEGLAAAPSNDPSVRDAARFYVDEIRGPHPLRVPAT